MLRSMISLAAVAALAAMTASVAAQDVRPLQLQTNQAYVEDANRPTNLAIGDPMAVFGFVFGGLPERVKVYPTENFYYFIFVHAGIAYAGNIRLAVGNRDDGKLNFVYFEQASDWNNEDSPETSRLLDAADGVKVEKLARLSYRVGYGGKSVVFELNDLSQVRPPAAAMGPDETFIGPIFDESGIRFFLVYNSKLKIFHYLLDETINIADQFVTAKGNDRILVGKRTGFAFYRDIRRSRKILIGVFEANVRLNNYFDGPFDQMPDNFNEGETFRQAVEAADPGVKGEINRFGAFADGGRYAIIPYMHYRDFKDLDVFHRCATSKRVPAASYYNCFVLAPGPERGAKARPLALERRPR